MEFYRWTQASTADKPEHPWHGFLRIELIGHETWDLTAGRYIDNWSPGTTASYEDEIAGTDFPFTNNDLHVYSARLKRLMERLAVNEIQYLPLLVKHRRVGEEVPGYYLANYLRLIDCLDRDRSAYQVWTKDNLLFWEHRPWMLGTFRGVTRAVLDTTKIGDVRVFRLWGWETMLVVREDVKQALEQAAITGGSFTEIDAS